MNSSVFPSDLTEHHVKSSALALVDGEPWPLHQPLTHSCSLTLLTFKDDDPTLVNQVLLHQKNTVIGFHILCISTFCFIKNTTLGEIGNCYVFKTFYMAVLHV